MPSASGATEEKGKPVDAKAELPDGTTFEGPDQLKAVLLRRKELVPSESDEQDVGLCAWARADRRIRAWWTILSRGSNAKTTVLSSHPSDGYEYAFPLSGAGAGAGAGHVKSSINGK